ncbi:hypothetical protein LAZ67_3001252 [Cordylochernes scorpioides]|uniref:Uncharacterized protein n=1 Tax=Cordylochernes scorpioides TaxID=51811 RepID=A0ABY6K6X4_9ARAC|nr:hypothetical protein LAZ67_3001252 [Cordylochernes scorpioides]
MCVSPRLWGDHGQALLENAHVCLINATATGTEVLKNLILPVHILCVFVKMDYLEYFAAIKFLILDGLTPKEIYSKWTKVYRNSAPLISAVKIWSAEFKHGHTSLENDSHEGRRKLLTHWKRCTILCWTIGEICEIAEAVQISEKKRLWNILHEKLGMRKLCARWVPHLLNADAQMTRGK